jgi:hypothetical protein
MEKSGKRGKIPQSDWPLIMARYEAGETLASIARTYDCSPPAISYVVSRSRARHSPVEMPAKPTSTAEPHLIKAAPSEGVAADAAPPATPSPAAIMVSKPNSNGADHDRPRPARLEAAIANPSGRRDEPTVRPADGAAPNHLADHHVPPPAPTARPPASPPLHQAPAAAAPANGEHRRTLHLSLGDGAHDNGSSHAAESRPVERPVAADRSEPVAPLAARGGNGAAPGGFAETRPNAHNGNGGQRRDTAGSFIDRELRARVEGDIAAFLQAFDAALAQDTQESRSGLREATDRLLRAGARTRIELERLEARVPLAPRDGDRRSAIAWRDR